MDLGQSLRNALAKITGAALVDEKAVNSLVKELQRLLISADVSVSLVFELSERIRRRALSEQIPPSISRKEHIVRVVYDELVSLMGEKYECRLGPQKILVVGLYGSGKTTTCGKLANFYKSRGLSVLLVCADVSRPAAYEQLKQLAEKCGVAFYGEKENTNATHIVRNALSVANQDVIIVDSSGRNAIEDELAKELREIGDVLKPDECFLVVSADIGQVAAKQAKAFNAAVGITGVIVTKMDGSAKGGGALSAVAASGSKIAFMGTGEKISDIEVFDAKKYVGRLLGFPDIEALLERVKEASKELDESMLEEKFTLNTFYKQMKAAKSMGPLKNIFSMLGLSDLPEEVLSQSEEKLRKYESIILSMTPEERENALLVKKSRSRIERIAKGSGRSVDDVKALLQEFERIEKMLNAIKKNRGMRRKFEKMLGTKLGG
ncbi:MAG: signal recognition particle receptor subunit alpha [Candidatus Micrarchaeia archaeon]